MPLSNSEIESALAQLSGWTRDGDAIRKQYTFADFRAAMAFVNRVAEKAEDADHHPDISVNYRRVTLLYSTHSAGGLTEKDLAGARMADGLV